MSHPKLLAIIAARGGSKRLPNKNVRLFNGKPLISHTIEAATDSTLLDKVIVSTDSEVISDVALKSGAEVPFLRPSDMATDQITVYPCLIHALDWLLENQDYTPDFTMLLQPTSPLRSSKDIDSAIKIIIEKHGGSVIGVTETKHNPYWCMKLSEDGTIDNFLEWDDDYSRFQDLPTAYGRNGAIFITNTVSLRKNMTFLNHPVYPYVMPPERSIDIDNEWDFELAQLIHRHSNKS